MVIFTGMTSFSGPLLTQHKPSEILFRHSEATRPVSRSVEHEIGRTTRHSRSLLIVKFGGSSLANARRIAEASKTVAKEYSRGSHVVVVVSAVGRTTDHLLRLTNGTSGIVGTDKDDILAMGERTSARIFAASLKGRGVQVRYFDPSDRDWPIVTDDNFSNANPLVGPSIQRIRRYIRPLLDDGIVPVVGGFIGRTRDGRVSTLGRGGSDTTALLLAKALGADEVVLVTSTAGIMSGDPKLVAKARRLERVGIGVLMGIADSGTKFIHRKALRYKEPQIDIRVISNKAGDLRAKGTIIEGRPLPELDVKLHNPHPVASVTLIGRGLSRRPELTRKVTGIARQVLVGGSQDSDSIILYVKQGPRFHAKLNRLHELIKREAGGVAMGTRTNMAMISVRGVGLEETPGVVARISEALRRHSINIFGLITIASSVIVFIDWKVRRLGERLVRQSLEEQ